MKKQLAKYYLWRRKSLRAKIRAMHFDPVRGPMDQRRYRRWQSLNDKYEKASLKWWRSREGASFAGEEFGLDITDMPFSMDELREAMPASPQGDGPEPALSAEWKYSNAEKKLVYVGNTSTFHEFKRIDGEIRHIINGEPVGYPVSPNVLGVRGD